MNNQLSLFESEEKVMTTKELAEVLNVDVKTVNNTVERLGVLLGSTSQKSNGGRPSKVFTEKQATLIKQEIQKHHNLASRQVDVITTDYEMELMTQKVLAYHIQKANEYKSRMEVAESALKRIEDGKGCFTIAQTAKALKLPYGRNTLFNKLKDMHLLSDHNEPYQDQIDAEHFKVVTKLCNDGQNHLVTLVTGKGLVYLAKKFNTEIDESVKADA